MVRFTATILQFGEQGEKTGWSYIEIPAKIAQQLKPGNKKSFRVKGKLDALSVKSMALMPMGGGDFIMALNATIRKGIKKNKGAKLVAELEADNAAIKPPPELLECLADEPMALKRYNEIPGSHRNYFTRWIESAKTTATKSKRIAQAVTALSKGQHYGEMLRALKNERIDF